MLWDDFSDDLKREIMALPTIWQQVEAWLRIHRFRQSIASLQEQARIFNAVCASTSNAIAEFGRILQEAEERDFNEVVEGF